MSFLPIRFAFRGLAILFVCGFEFADVSNSVLDAQEHREKKLSEPDSSSSIVRISDIDSVPSRIAFGSCSHQNKPQPILDTIVGKSPSLFIYLGDNIYGDTKKMDVLRERYQQLGDKAEFQNLRTNVPVLSIWDDHDYGWNDAGKEYEFKTESREIFFDFWQVPKDSPRRQHEGIYGAHRFQQGNHTLQVILLDTRTFRDPLKHNPRGLSSDSGFKNAYQPDSDPNKTLLGQSQWQWLEQQLLEPADLRIICTSIQFGHEYNGWESWTNLPEQQKKMVDLIRSTKANGVVFISGDVHWGEISHRNFDNLYPLYDVTASGLTEEWYNVEPNRFRIGEAVRDNHFGMIEIDWTLADPAIELQVIDGTGTIRNRHVITLAELQLAKE